MPFPLIAAGVGAVGNIIGGIMGSKAEKAAADQNYQINLMNYYQRERERQEAINEARTQRAEAHLGQTDAQGNRVYFVPGQGWVTELSPESRQMNEVQRREEMLRLNQDLPAARQKMFENLSRQRGEENRATAIMEAMGRHRREDPREVTARRNLAAAEGINQGFDETENAMFRELIRSGSSGVGKAAARSGAARGEALRKAFLENQSGAKAESDEAYERGIANMGNNYNMWATRASGMPPAQFNPRDVYGPANQMLSGARGQGGQASSNLLNAFGKQGGTMEEQPALMGPAKTVIGGTNALVSGLERVGAGNRNEDAYSQYSQYGGGGGYSPLLDKGTART